MNRKKIDRETQQVIDGGDEGAGCKRGIISIPVENERSYCSDERSKNNDAEQGNGYYEGEGIFAEQNNVGAQHQRGEKNAIKERNKKNLDESFPQSLIYKVGVGKTLYDEGR